MAENLDDLLDETPTPRKAGRPRKTPEPTPPTVAETAPEPPVADGDELTTPDLDNDDDAFLEALEEAHPEGKSIQDYPLIVSGEISAERIEAGTLAVETPTQKRIRELQEALDKPFEAPAPPVNVLSEEEILIKELEHKLAQRNNQAVSQVNVEPTYDAVNLSEDTFFIHFVADGFTAFGKVWVTGEEVPIPGFGSPIYQQTVDRLGKSWLDLTEGDQIARYGKVFFRNGPWQGQKFDDPVLQAKAEKARLQIPRTVLV